MIINTKKKATHYVLLVSILCLFLGHFSCTKKVIQSKSDLKVLEMSPVNPILKGLSKNPLLRLTINIPEGSEVMGVQTLRCKINESAVKDLQKVDIFFTDSDAAFADINSMVSIPITHKEFDIPVNLSLKAGLHYIWFSGVLKNDANIDNQISFSCTKIITTNMQEYLVISDVAAQPKRLGIALRKAGDDGINTYRIPGIITTNSGTLVAVYDNRLTSSGDLPGDIDVGCSRSTDGGKTWENMKVIADMGEPHNQNGIGDPSILYDHINNKIWVANLWSKGNHSIAGSQPGLSPDVSGQFVLISSDDDGKTWSKPYNITSQVKNPAWKILFQGPGSGITMQDGKLVFPAQYWDASNVPYSTLIYSDDKGITWKRAGAGAKSNTTESQIIETAKGKLMLSMRDNRGTFRSISTTINMGDTWVAHPTSYNTLLDPICMASLINTKVKTNGSTKDVLFFSNPNTASGRFNITIKASLDLGETWQPSNQLLIDSRNCYGYSSMTKIDENTIGILYEGTKDLYFVRVPVSEIIK